MVSETKLDESFFGVPYRVDRNDNGGEIMLFAREDVPSKLLFEEKSPTEAFFR